MVKYIQKAVFFRGSDDADAVNKLLEDGYHYYLTIGQKPCDMAGNNDGILIIFEKTEGEDNFEKSDDESDSVVPPPKVNKTRKPRTKKVKVEEDKQDTTATIPETV